MQEKRISYWQPQAANLQELLEQAAGFLRVKKVDAPLNLAKKQLFLSALPELSAHYGLRAIEVCDKANIDLQLPMLARRKKNSEVVLIIPLSRSRFGVGQSSALGGNEILDQFDDFIQLYPSEPRRMSFSFTTFAAKIAGYLPKKQQLALGFLTVFLLFSAVILMSILLSEYGYDNKGAFAVAAATGFAVVLFFAHLAQGRLAKNLPMVHLWTLDFIYRTIFAQPAQEFARLHVNDIKMLLKKVSNDIKIYFINTYLLIASCVFILAVLLVLFYVDMYLFFLLLLPMIFMFLCGFILFKNKNYNRDQAEAKKTALNEMLDGFCAAFDALIGLGAYAAVLEKIAKANKTVKSHEIRVSYINFFLKIARFILPLISVWFMVVSLIYLNHPDLDVWQIFCLFFVAIIFGLSVAFLLQAISTDPLVPITKKNLHKLDKICLVKNESRVRIINMKGGIEAINISFFYDDNSSLILRNINLKIMPEKFYLIHGASGIGKSTLLQVLMTQFLPTSGQLIFDGQDVLSLDLPDLRKNFGVVRQDSLLMAGSILDNILAGRDLPNKNIKELMLRHEAFDLLLDLPMGLQTYVYWHAKNLSRLEQILVLLARAIVHRPKILFLDEALMGIAEHEQKRLGKLLHELPATKILVSHESKNIYDADEVVLLH